MVHLNVFDAAVNTESQTIQCERIRNDMHGKNDRQSTNNTLWNSTAAAAAAASKWINRIHYKT